MKELQNLASNYIKNISGNIYRIDNYEKDKEQILDMIVLEKYKKSLTDFTFKEEDLALVRIVNENNFPINLEYFPLDERNYYQYIENPFKYILGWLNHEMGKPYEDADVGCDKKIIKFRGDNLVAYRYQSTKHFSVNGLASNIYGSFGYKVEFDKGSAIIIEPLKDKLNDDRLVCLNPVDTFFDLENSSMKIGENAIFLIQEDKLSHLFQNQQIKQKLQSKTIYLYSGEASLAVDLVLMYNGYIPQHSYQQSKLEIEYSYQQGITDEQYLNKFEKFINHLNRKYLNTTYINASSSIDKRRRPYAVLTAQKNIQETISTYEQYIPSIFSKSISFDTLVVNRIIKAIKKDVNELGYSPLEQTFYTTTHNYESILLKVIEEITYPEFKRITENFNEKKLSKINPQRRG